MKKMLVNLLLLVITIFSSNAFPSPGDYDQTAFQVPVDQQFIQQTANTDYFDVDDSKSTLLLEQTADFTISCLGQDRICVQKGNCLNGYIHLTNHDLLANKGQVCRVQDEVCCQAIVESEIGSSASDQDFVGNSKNPGFVKQRPAVPRPPIIAHPPQQIPTSMTTYFLRYEFLTPCATRKVVQNDDLDNISQEKHIPNVQYCATFSLLLFLYYCYNIMLQTISNEFRIIFTYPVNPFISHILTSIKLYTYRDFTKMFNIADVGIGVPTHLQLGCAAALLCVEEQFCTQDGTVSTEQVHLTSRQLLQRVPLSSCKNVESGIIGKCCRDPNYVDPWPAGNLPANYSGGFDEQGFPTFLNIAKVRPPTVKTPVRVPIQTTSRPVILPPKPTSPPEEQLIQSDNSDIFPDVLIPPPETPPEVESIVDSTNIVEAKEKCGVRHKNLETSDSRTTFGEIPWQAMVLQSKDRNILCSGALISTHDVLTAANCIDSMSADDVSIKLGEWKLGYELKHEEPLPYEIINVSSISMHPGYTKGHGEHDLAILHLETPAILDHHVNTLCLPETNQLPAKKSCIATGWGKSILQAHYTGAIMHAVDMSILPTNLCKEQLTAANVSPHAADGIICTTPKEDINNVCEADVGGPLACQNEEGYYELSGIYSQDTGCQSSNQVGIFAPLDDKWMKETMLSQTYEQVLSTISEQTKTSEREDQLINSNDFRESTLFEDNQYLPPN
ncbi:inactive serine protease scarface [Halictus rubicundus]|uniref:inactive serine protease scarface n=1 Tax=Halictus rubicundus TaxID=77578 RepID=UPI0040350713